MSCEIEIRAVQNYITKQALVLITLVYWCIISSKQFSNSHNSFTKTRPEAPRTTGKNNYDHEIHLPWSLFPKWVAEKCLRKYHNENPLFWSYYNLIMISCGFLKKDHKNHVQTTHWDRDRMSVDKRVLKINGAKKISQKPFLSPNFFLFFPLEFVRPDSTDIRPQI